MATGKTFLLLQEKLRQQQEKLAVDAVSIRSFFHATKPRLNVLGRWR